MSDSDRRQRIALWVIRGILAAEFLYAGGFKLVTPMAALAQASPLPAAFLKFIGLCEVAGALGLILPDLAGVWLGATRLAAAGLTIIMIGATVVTIMTLGVGQAVAPFITGVLTTIVAVKHRPRTMPLRAP